MKKDKGYLARLRDKLKPENALLGVAESMLPQLGELLMNMEKPIDEGGALADGWEKMAFVIVYAHGDTKINVCPLKREGSNMVMGAPINGTSALDIFKQQPEGNGDGN